MKNIIVKLLGARGSSPIGGESYREYGGATSCIMVKMGSETILLDAGSGLLTIKKHLEREIKRLHILISHPHVDHLAGLPACPLLFEPDITAEIYAVPRGGLSALRQVEALVAPPLWPIGVDVFSACVSFHDITSQSFHIGAVRVDTMEGSHPGGCTVFRLTYGEKSIVYATDFEQGTGADEQLRCFAENCTLLLCDGAYSEQELLQMRGFGHSTWSFAAQMGVSCGALQTIITHHALFRTDEELNRAEKAVRAFYPSCSFAREGDELVL